MTLTPGGHPPFGRRNPFRCRTPSGGGKIGIGLSPWFYFETAALKTADVVAPGGMTAA